MHKVGVLIVIIYNLYCIKTHLWSTCLYVHFETLAGPISHKKFCKYLKRCVNIILLEHLSWKLTDNVFFSLFLCGMECEGPQFIWQSAHVMMFAFILPIKGSIKLQFEGSQKGWSSLMADRGRNQERCKRHTSLHENYFWDLIMKDEHLENKSWDVSFTFKSFISPPPFLLFFE